MSEIIVISEHSQKSLTSKSLDFDSRQNSVSSEVSEAIRIPSWNFRNSSRISDSSQNSRNFEVLRLMAESEILRIFMIPEKF